MRDIKAQPFAWTTREAWEKIETLPFKKQMSCKMVYVALSIISKKQKNSEKIEAYKFMIAKYGSMSEKSVQRYLPELENLGIISIEPQDRESNGKFKKCKIWLRDTVFAAGHMEDSSWTDGGQMEDTESDINNKDNKPIKTNKDIITAKAEKKFSDDDLKFAKKFFEAVRENFLFTQKKTEADIPEILENWADEFRKLREIDELSEKGIEYLLNWLFEDTSQDAIFWRKQIRTPAKLRKKNKEGSQYWRVLVLKIKESVAQKPTSTNFETF